MTALATDSGRKTPARLAGSAILAMQSDERLVKLLRSGHERAFEAIVERYRKPLVRFCGRILPESRCEDAVQQAFVNAHAALVASDEPVQLKPWLYTITRNAALNMLRQNGWNYDEIPLEFDGVRRPDQVVEQRIELQQTVAAVNELPERQRSALVMRELEGRSYDEIALALGANDGAVRQLLNRARATLRHAASAVMPPPIVDRAAAHMPPSDGRRLAELLGGLGAAGIAKAGATAVVAGTLVVGAVEAPLPIGDGHKTTREKATLSADKPASANAAVAAIAAHRIAERDEGQGHRAEDQPAARTQRAGAATDRSRARTHHSDGSGHGRSGSEGSSETQHRGSSEDRHQSGSGERSSSGLVTEAEDHSGPGGGGSDDGVTATLITTDDAVGTSGTSGSDDGSSGTSGTSGSDGSGSSGSDDSSSGSAETSGSSGSSDGADTLDH